jgi:hypothetical protein
MAFRVNTALRSNSGRIWLLPVAAIAFFLGTAGAMAQTAGPDEAVNPRGVVAQKLALTEAQRSAIYNAVRRQGMRAFDSTLAAEVGAPVPRSAMLLELPDQAAADQPWAEFLKYAMVDDDVVVVDPMAMRVVDVIHGNARP